MPIGSVRNGDRAVIEGEIQLAEIVFRRRRTLLVRLADGTGFGDAAFLSFLRRATGTTRARPTTAVFRRIPHGARRARNRPPGVSAGRCRRRRRRQPESLTPIYPATEGVQQGRLRVLTDLALGLLAQGASSTSCRQACSMRSSCRRSKTRCATCTGPLRVPTSQQLAEGCHPAQRRLAFEELLAHQLCLRLLRQATDQDLASPLPRRHRPHRSMPGAAAVPIDRRAVARVAEDIGRDLAASAPDDAARAGRRRVRQDRGRRPGGVAGRRARHAGAFMAPTELLAEQHARNLQRVARSAGRARRLAHRPPDRQGRAPRWKPILPRARSTSPWARTRCSSKA